MVRHLGAGLTWIIVSFIAVLALASILEQRAVSQREAMRAPAAEPAAPTAPGLRTVADEQRSRGRLITVSNRISE